MARYLTKLVAGAVLAGGAAWAAGCHADGEHGEFHHGDPCWPDRYANESRAAVVATFQPQVENGQVLDQTVWNMHFEFGSDKLNGAGMDKLDQLSRRRPSPDQRVFIQTARDIVYDAEKPGDYASRIGQQANGRSSQVPEGNDDGSRTRLRYSGARSGDAGHRRGCSATDHSATAESRWRCRGWRIEWDCATVDLGR